MRLYSCSAAARESNLRPNEIVARGARVFVARRRAPRTAPLPIGQFSVLAGYPKPD